MKKSLALSEVYKYLEPGPVVLLTTSRAGTANIMTMSWHTMLDFEPPLIGCVVSSRNHSFRSLIKSKECVINIPAANLIRKVVGCGNTSGRSVDKFKKFRLTAEPAEKVNAPLIRECFAGFECKLTDLRFSRKYNFFVLKVVKAWQDPKIKNPRTIHHMGMGQFMIAGRKLKLPSKMK